MHITQQTPEMDPDKLYADLTTPPPFDKRFDIEDVVVFQRYLDSGQCPASEVGYWQTTVEDRIARLKAELLRAESDPKLKWLNEKLREVTLTLRVRPDIKEGRLYVEQWVPALNCWLVCSKWKPHVDQEKILADVQAGDPRLKTPLERLKENRALAERNRAANESRSNDQLADAISSLPASHVENFVAVEKALASGEQITLRGGDRQFVEKAEANTRKLAEAGDPEAQAALTLRRAVDTPSLINRRRRRTLNRNR